MELLYRKLQENIKIQIIAGVYREYHQKGGTILLSD
jgi:hypothetical protein